MLAGGGGSTNIWKIPYVSSFLFLKASLSNYFLHLHFWTYCINAALRSMWASGLIPLAKAICCICFRMFSGTSSGIRHASPDLSCFSSLPLLFVLHDLDMFLINWAHPLLSLLLLILEKSQIFLIPLPRTRRISSDEVLGIWSHDIKYSVQKGFKGISCLNSTFRCLRLLLDCLIVIV